MRAVAGVVPDAAGWRTIASEALKSLRRPALLLLAVGLTTAAAADLAMDRVFNTGAPSLSSANVNNMIGQLRYTLALPGVFGDAGSDKPLVRAYFAIAAIFVVLVLVLPRTRAYRGRPEVRHLDHLAIGALLCCGASILFGFVIDRSDLGLVPIYFYALFLCTCGALVVSLTRSGVLRVTVVCLLGLALAASTTLSVSRSFAIQRAMGTWSLQRLAYAYQSLYLDRETIPPQRRLLVARQLAAVGLYGSGQRTDYLAILACDAQHPVPSRPRVVTASVWAFEDDRFFPYEPLRCTRRALSATPGQARN